jgi:hypothetical protein
VVLVIWKKLALVIILYSFSTKFTVLVTGSSPDCPADTFEPSALVCRNATGSCDLEETCTGEDSYFISFSVCVCVFLSSFFLHIILTVLLTGTSPDCPADTFEPSGLVCRIASGSCDLEETCTGDYSYYSYLSISLHKIHCSLTGSSPDCPADTLEPSGLVCRNATGSCDLEETCTGENSYFPFFSF